MRIIVTGGCGFIGSAFIRHIINHTNFSVLNVDNQTYAANKHALKEVESDERYSFNKMNICSGDLVYKLMCEFQPNALVNFAAESHVDKSIDSPGVFLKTNIIGTYQLLEASLRYFKLNNFTSREQFIFHHISTDEVYGDIKKNDLPASEVTKYAPNSPYSASKASSDHLVNAWHNTFKLPTLITNCSNNYGPFQNPEKFIPLIIFKALKKESLPIYGDGMQIRDWLYVDDHIEAITLTLLNGRIGNSYNISAKNQIANLEVVEYICKHLNNLNLQKGNTPFKHESLITFVKDRPGHDRRYALNSNKILDELGWSPRNSFKEGLNKTIDWYIDYYLSHENKLEKIERQGRS